MEDLNQAGVVPYELPWNGDISECYCIGRARYYLLRAEIPLTIFHRLFCPRHSEPKSDSNGYVQCLLKADGFIKDSEDVSTWETTYHGAPVSIIQSILLHGELLMEGDVLCDGSYLERRHQKANDEMPAIWTYPDREGADRGTKLATFDEGQTSFKALIELRQRPGTFSKHKTHGGYEIYATDRRGSILLWAVHIQVHKSIGEVSSSKPALNQIIHPFPDICRQGRSCVAQTNARKVLRRLEIPPEMLDERFDHCYCRSCFPDHLPHFKELAGETFIIPRGWVKFGVKINESFVKMNDVWDCWNSAYHGCAPEKVISILKHRSLLIPGDQLCDGTKLGVNSSADVNQKCYFFSPTIVYSSHPWYSQFRQIDMPWYAKSKQKYFQTVLLFKVRPGSFDKQQETEGGEMLMFDDYSTIKQDEIEWCSSRRGCSMPYAILVRVVNKKQYDIITKQLIYDPDARSYRRVK